MRIHVLDRDHGEWRMNDNIHIVEDANLSGEPPIWCITVPHSDARARDDRLGWWGEDYNYILSRSERMLDGWHVSTMGVLCTHNVEGWPTSAVHFLTQSTAVAARRSCDAQSLTAPVSEKQKQNLVLHTTRSPSSAIAAPHRRRRMHCEMNGVSEVSSMLHAPCS